MAGDESEKNAEATLQPDVKSAAIVPSTPREARALARVIGGDLPPNRGVFWCLTCGFIEDEAAREKGGVSRYPKGLTIEFDDDEMAAMDGDPYAYVGPCPVCQSMMLVNYETMGGDGFSIRGRARESRKQEFGEAADAFLDKVEQRAGAVIASALTGSPMPQPSQSAEPKAAPAGRDDLPDASEVDLSNIKPR